MRSSWRRSRAGARGAENRARSRRGAVAADAERARLLPRFTENLRMSSSASKPMLELTLRGLILGVLITLVFTAANVYLGLKVGLTFATSIPAAVISMADRKSTRLNSSH